MKTLYSIGISLYGVCIAVAALFNKKARKLYCGQRKAFSVLAGKIDPSKRYIWIHAASVGEFEQGRPLIEKIKSEQPDTPVLLTFYSPSGYEAKKNYPYADIVSYLPSDTKRNARKFVKMVNPSKAVFVKYEFWPNYLLALQEKGIPTFIVSAIFRRDQLFFKSYGKWYLSLLKTFDHIFVQTQASADLLAEYGVDKDVTVAGDTRFDRVVEQSTMAKQFPLIEQFVDGKPVIIAGSTWLKDEELLIQYLNETPDIKLIIVPHEINKSHLYDIFKLLQGNYIRYTDATVADIDNYNCMVVDAIGMLSSLYQYASVAYIGGGFGVGIHNLLEAAVYDVPVVFGPNYQKFNEAKELIKAGGGFSVNNYAELKDIFGNLLSDTENNTGKIAGNYVRENTGATEKIFNLLK